MKFICILCKGRKSEIISQKTRDNNSQVFKCCSCSHIQLYPVPSTKEDKYFYNQDLQSKNVFRIINILDLEKRSAIDTQRRTGIIRSKFDQNKSVLDIGSGYGFFIKAIGDAGFQTTGLEVSSARREIAKTVTNVRLLSKAISGPNITKNHYDIITLFHVLEHIKDPIRLCENLKSFLKKDGTLIIEIPNTNHYLLKINKPYQEFYWQRAHISYFTPETVLKVLKIAGYRKIKIMGIQRYSFINALCWIFLGKPQLENPSYQTVTFGFLNNLYKRFLIEKLTCDTLWIEAAVK